tara:strand:+ start:6944 stop:7114 length:171 start_codon:yes stop_codon:yes gene_type:complete
MSKIKNQVMDIEEFINDHLNSEKYETWDTIKSAAQKQFKDFDSTIDEIIKQTKRNM